MPPPVRRLCRRAHPRGGGENDPVESAQKLAEGSSPRGRGKRDVRPGERGRGRLIPAGAGKTSSKSPTSLRAWAHPRGGGENLITRTTRVIATGSSPRGRGKRQRLALCCRYLRLIPAGAGKTLPERLSCDGVVAHPRGGGENCELGEHQGRQRWLIPAGAGKTPWLHPRWRGCRAHPRGGGENYGVEIELAPGYGSSPRGRGKRGGGRLPGGRGRLIPAGAGKTQVTPSLGSALRAHPRGGGENEAGDEKGSTFDGSSPRGRGKLCRQWSQTRPKRLIPAGAGKTLA